MQKLKRTMDDDVHIQKAQDALIAAKMPYLKAKNKWKSEIEAIELELKARGIRHGIKWDDIYEES